MQSLAAHVGQADPRPAEYLLQKVLLLLAAMHKRSACGKTPVQLRELAEAAFDALRAVNACEVRLHNLTLLWSPGLTMLCMLVTESPLLCSPNQ